MAKTETEQARAGCLIKMVSPVHPRVTAVCGAASPDRVCTVHTYSVDSRPIVGSRQSSFSRILEERGDGGHKS